VQKRKIFFMQIIDHISGSSIPWLIDWPTAASHSFTYNNYLLQVKNSTSIGYAGKVWTATVSFEATWNNVLYYSNASLISPLKRRPEENKTFIWANSLSLCYFWWDINLVLLACKQASGSSLKSFQFSVFHAWHFPPLLLHLHCSLVWCNFTDILLHMLNCIHFTECLF
jgi:hypothetical protein